jgi:hypothetical protein
MTGPAPTAPAARSDTRNAWLAAVLIPGALLAMFLVGDGLLSFLGYPGGVLGAPLWAVVVAYVPVLVLVSVPVHVSAFYARRAAERGDVRGWVPTRIMTVLTFGLLVLTIGQYLLAWALGWR